VTNNPQDCPSFSFAFLEGHEEKYLIVQITIQDVNSRLPSWLFHKHLLQLSALLLLVRKSVLQYLEQQVHLVDFDGFLSLSSSDPP
jgi:hypothetical protein